MANKSDLKQTMLQIHENEKIILGQCEHFEISAEENKGIKEAFTNLVLKCILNNKTEIS